MTTTLGEGGVGGSSHSCRSGFALTDTGGNPPVPAHSAGHRFLRCPRFPIGACDSPRMSRVPLNIHPLSRSTLLWGMSHGQTWQKRAARFGVSLPPSHLPSAARGRQKAAYQPLLSCTEPKPGQRAGRRCGETQARHKQGAGVKSTLHRPKRDASGVASATDIITVARDNPRTSARVQAVNTKRAVCCHDNSVFPYVRIFPNDSELEGTLECSLGSDRRRHALPLSLLRLFANKRRGERG